MMFNLTANKSTGKIIVKYRGKSREFFTLKGAIRFIKVITEGMKSERKIIGSNT